MYGPADEVDSHPSGGTYQRPAEEGGGSTSTFPFETWRYRYLEGIGTNINIEFVDRTMTGEYRMTIDPSEKDALLHVPGHQVDPTQTAGRSEFDRLQQYVELLRPPRTRFPDLEIRVSSGIRYNILPMKVRVDFFPITGASVYTAVTVQFENRDLQFQNRDGMQNASMNIAGTFTTMTHRPVARFEDGVAVNCLPGQLADYTSR